MGEGRQGEDKVLWRSTAPGAPEVLYYRNGGLHGFVCRVFGFGCDGFRILGRGCGVPWTVGFRIYSLRFLLRIWAK